MPADLTMCYRLQPATASIIALPPCPLTLPTLTRSSLSQECLLELVTASQNT